jgi:hypothetical protein
MNRILNTLIALLLPSLVGCGSNREAQDVPEEIYACPMPGDLNQDEPTVEQDSIVIEQDSTKNNKHIKKQKTWKKN